MSSFRDIEKFKNIFSDSAKEKKQAEWPTTRVRSENGECFRFYGDPVFFSLVWFDVVTEYGKEVKVAAFATNVNPITGEVTGECPFVKLSGHRQQFTVAMNVLRINEDNYEEQEERWFTKYLKKLIRIFIKPKEVKRSLPNPHKLVYGAGTDETPLEILLLPDIVFKSLCEMAIVQGYGNDIYNDFTARIAFNPSQIQSRYTITPVSDIKLPATDEELSYPQWDLVSYYLKQMEVGTNADFETIKRGVKRKAERDRKRG